MSRSASAYQPVEGGDVRRDQGIQLGTPSSMSAISAAAVTGFVVDVRIDADQVRCC